MKTKFLRIYTIMGIFLLFFALSTLPSNIFQLNSQNRVQNPNASANFTIVHITIDGNDALDDFCSENGTGDGSSWLTAYRIENYSIDANRSGTGLVLKNTDKFVSISNLTIKNSGRIVDNIDAGIKIENCSNVLLNNCSMSSNYYGFAVVDSNNVEISENFAGDNNSIGIYLENSDSNEISENILENNSLHGVYIKNSDLNNISNNEIFNNSIILIPIPDSEEYGTNFGSGIFISSADNNSVMNNDIYSNSIGLYLKFSSNNIISHNVFWNNTICIKIYESPVNVITDNGDCEIVVVPIVPIIPGYSTVFVILVSVPVILILLNKVKKKIVK